ncbi:barstar family protein [Rhodocyclus tenuis]|uniref:barstar family protein n=1 Tax=Rhodocyclus tenuis TaxID=1066 RepID=UPI0019066012|nr:barstar family protein [Rhodocyclus tenuis]MBK1681187.1 hypothetical protein [Rhodocyclus tenuis]
MTPEPNTPARPEPTGETGISATAVLGQQCSGGIHRLPEACRAELRAAAADRGLLCGEVDLGKRTSAAEALTAIGSALNFPAWYGANFDALADCLDDYGDEPASGGVVLLRGSEALRASDPAALETLIAVLAEVSAKRRDSVAPLWIFLAEAPASGAPKTQP